MAKGELRHRNTITGKAHLCQNCGPKRIGHHVSPWHHRMCTMQHPLPVPWASNSHNFEMRSTGAIKRLFNLNQWQRTGMQNTYQKGCEHDVKSWSDATCAKWVCRKRDWLVKKRYSTRFFCMASTSSRSGGLPSSWSLATNLESSMAPATKCSVSASKSCYRYCGGCRWVSIWIHLEPPGKGTQENTYISTTIMMKSGGTNNRGSSLVWISLHPGCWCRMHLYLHGFCKRWLHQVLCEDVAMTCKKASRKAAHRLPANQRVHQSSLHCQANKFNSAFSTYVRFRTARRFCLIITHIESWHLPCMWWSLSEPASVMQPASRSAMARIEPEGSEGKSISLSSSGWKETRKLSMIWTVWHASVGSWHILGTLFCK